MADTVDELQIKINAEATKANDAIDRLVGKLDRLTTSLSRVNGTNLNGLTNLTNQGLKVGSASNSIVKGLSRTATATKKAGIGFKGLASYIGKFYATYFMVIRGIKKLWSSIESTADYIESYNYFNVALGKIGSDWSHQYEQYGYENAESYAKSFSTRLSESLGKLSGLKMEIGADGKGLLTESGLKNLGLNIQEITQYASQLASVTNSVGQTGEVSLAVASSFTKLAGDISSLFNVDYSSVSRNLQSGLIGQSRALYKYGIDITNATLQTYAYNLGLSKSVSEMTQAEKMQLRMLAILDQSKVSWGDLANTINSPSNMIRQLTNNLKETGIVLGQLFIPVLQKVLPVINGVTIAIKRLLVSIAGLLGIKIDLDAFGQGYTEIEDDIDGITGSYEDAAAAVEEYKNQLLGFDEVQKLSDTSATASIDVSDNTIDLTKEIIEMTGAYEEAWSKAYAKMENEAQIIADKIYGIITGGKWYEAGESLGALLSDGIDSDENKLKWEDVGKWITNTICGALDFVNGFISSVDWQELGSQIVTAIGNINLGKITVNALDVVISLAGATISLYFGIWQGIYDEYGLGGLILAIIGSSTPGGILQVKLLIEFFSEIDGAKFIENIEEWWKNTGYPTIDKYLLEPYKAAYSIVIEPIVSIAQSVVEKAWENMQEYWKALKPALNVGIEILQSVVDAAKNALKSLWGSPVMQVALNVAQSALDSLWENIQSNWENVKAKLKVGLILIENAVSLLWDTTMDLWDNISGALVTGLSLASNAVSEWWESVKQKWKFMTGLLSVGLGLAKNALSDFWSNVKYGWGLMRATLSISLDWVKNAIQNLWTRGQNTFNSIKKNLLVSIDWISDTIKRLWENLKTAWNNITKGGLSISITSILGIGTSGGGFGARFATGGFPEDGLFYKNNDEIITQVGGKAQVLNREDTHDMIRQAAYEGMLMAMSQSSNNTNVNVVLQGDADGLFKVVQSKANNYTRQNGTPAFMV